MTGLEAAADVIAVIEEFGSIVNVQTASAGVTVSNVEKTPSFADSTPVTAISETLTAQAAFERFGIEARRPVRLHFRPADAEHFTIGSKVTGTPYGILYVVSPVRFVQPGDTPVIGDVLLDIEPQG